jgi:hypothetical protein
MFTFFIASTSRSKMLSVQSSIIMQAVRLSSSELKLMLWAACIDLCQFVD